MSRQALFKRRYRRDEEAIPFLLNGLPEAGRRGDTVMTAILSLETSLRRTEFTGESRAGFCLIGACQDCFVMMADGSRVRACSTALEPGMAFLTDAVEGVEHD
ncbi:ferredoxin [Ensifer adhaerens]|uniref:Ferredoxin n=1 Tax=Ensifer adhaerens TaxID=106592 RepID=A0A0L8BSY1_ENSAD|nr:(2Fe-2S)-binding protein [Ensifer adhaerens]KOF17645.1 ferredoxin [Ensifer adhaerens]